ncbi:hypothetical protein GCM10027275_24810 [Rhabdobacter roseus]|uniref:Putative RNase H-like nuclease (RuvC/YqgF family) n=1 Tax=Rhabdobacter roseus TaxID=1655419 RepID=A0A840TLI0_9BACT|nr:hypothetical protein [Rhabdobacter roseus]MBB5284421.1 putative RNase H-like nuclease (RuvC/YqgF family) [Rhabdobacter roseus]
MTFLDFLIDNWDRIFGLGGTITGLVGWISERGKRMRDNRNHDVAFWEKTIEAQNAHIERQNARIEALENKYERRIKELETHNQQLQEEVTELSSRLEKYESTKRKPIPQKATT